MNLLRFLDTLALADAQPDPAPARRAALAQLGRTALAALPLALGAGVQPAVAQRTGTLLDALQALVRIEWLQDEFFSRVLGFTPVTPAVSPALVPAAMRPDLELMRTHQRQHISLLESVIRESGGVLPARPRYDFTGSNGGSRAPLFADVFTNTDTMLAVAQVLIDASTRTYISQLPLLLSNNDLLDLAMRMQAVEGRHASHVRRLRIARGASVKSWVSGTDGGGPLPAVNDVYAGEDRVRQLITVTKELDTTTLFPTDGANALSAAERTAAATESFDEPLPLAGQDALAKFLVV